jgi:hypothetical protein
MSKYPNYTLTQLAELILQFETKEGLSPAVLADLKEFASSALENASQPSRAVDAAKPSCVEYCAGIESIFNRRATNA